MWRCTFSILSILVFSTQLHAQNSLPAPGAAKEYQPELGKIVDTETAVFAQFHLAPIIIPEGERVGDIIDTGTPTLIAGSADCFPQLSPRSSPSQLPAITIQSDEGLAAALGLNLSSEANANVAGDAGKSHSFILDFDNVTVQRVSLYQLRTLIRKNIPECDVVRPFIDSDYIAPAPRRKPNHVAENNSSSTTSLTVSDHPPPLLVGMLFTAKRVIHVRIKEELSGDAKLSVGQSFLKRFGIGTKFKVAADTNSDSQVDLVGVDDIPVAFAPAFIVTSKRQLAAGKSEYSIASVNTDDVLSSIHVARAKEDNEISVAKQNDNKLWADYVIQLEIKMANNKSLQTSSTRWIITEASATEEGYKPALKSNIAIDKAKILRSILGVEQPQTNSGG